MRVTGRIIAAGILAALGLAVSAQTVPASVASATPAQRQQLEVLDEVLAVPSVSWEHPDLRYRNLGIEAYKQGDKARALALFLAAARYADKPSEAMIAAMYWNGDGTTVDHPRAYAWMDLAASRGYRGLILQREAYWSRLSEPERARALEVGKTVYDEYDDVQGLRRLSLKLSRAHVEVTGSHAGWVGNGKILVPGPGSYGGSAGGLLSASGTASVFRLDQFYNDNLYDVQAYTRLKDLDWGLKSLVRGEVTVGDLQKLPDQKTPEQKIPEPD